VLADRWYPSSKLCSARGVKNRMLGLGEREWACAACGACHDCDTNAGINVKGLATSALAARPALPVASQAATPARHEPGQQDGSG
jgi:putative transposase